MEGCKGAMSNFLLDFHPVFLFSRCYYNMLLVSIQSLLGTRFALAERSILLSIVPFSPFRGTIARRRQQNQIEIQPL